MSVRDVRHFISLKSTELKKFLRERDVPVGDENHDELAERAFWAEKLGLKVKASDEEAEHDIQQSKKRNLVFDGGIIQLPRPETLTNGWESGPACLPETSRDDLDSYIKAGNRRIGLEKTEGKRTLGLGKGLLLSGHVRALQYHGISANLSYCFVRGKIIPQQKTTEMPYNTWVVLKKESGQVCTGECTCIVGIQSTCKHIAALLFAVVEAVEQGKNAASTSQKQVWGQPPKRGECIHQPKFVKDIKIVGIKEDVVEQLSTSSRIYRSDFDPRVKAHRVKKELGSFDLDSLASITNGDCGLFAHVQREANPQYGIPDLSLCVKEETVESTFPALTIQEAYDSFENSEDVTASKLVEKLKVNAHQQEVLAKETLKPASSSLWADHRRGRITASVAGDVANSVKNGKISGHSQIARIMGYYGKPQSAAMSWGKNKEHVARKQYIAHHRRRKHTGVTCTETGLWASGHTWCDFAVRTVSDTNNFFVERINLDLLYINSIRPDIEIFFY